MTDPKVLVGAPCAKFPVYDEFYDFFYGLIVPPNSPPRRRMKGGSIPKNLNALVDAMLESDATHLFIVEDDSAFAPDTVMRLLAHQVPVVAGVCRARHAPFAPYIYRKAMDPEKGLLFRPLGLTDRGLIGPKEDVGATGMGGILIQRDVFTKLERPYFTHYHAGEIEWGQDLVFGKKLIEAGVDVYCDLDVTIWHATQCIIGTDRDQDGYYRTKFIIDQADFTVRS